jgi:hypothetical protein
MEFEEKNEEFEGNMTRNLKEKHREFYTWDVIHRKLILKFFTWKKFE